MVNFSKDMMSVLKEQGITYKSKLTFKNIHEYPADETGLELDNSGSTASGFTGDDFSILQRELQIVKMFHEQFDNIQHLAAWNSSRKYYGNDIRQFMTIGPQGGTTPQIIFQNRHGEPDWREMKLFIFFTDGSISGRDVEEMRKKMKEMKLDLAICVYTGKRNFNPSILNLPVFSPVIENSNACILLHADKTSLKAILSSGTHNLPDSQLKQFLREIPLEVSRETSWDEFPEFDISLLNDFGLGKIELRNPHTDVHYEDDLVIDLTKFKEFLHDESISNKLKIEAIQEIFAINDPKIGRILDKSRPLCREIARKWFDEVREEAKNALEDKELNDEISTLTKQFRVHYKNREKEEISRISPRLQELLEKRRKLSKGGISKIQEEYDSLIKFLNTAFVTSNAPQTTTGHSLKELMEFQGKRVSNRVRQRTVEGGAAKNVDCETAYDFDNCCKTGEDGCLICGESGRPMAIIVVESEDQKKNAVELMSDYAQNAPLDSGAKTARFIPSGEFCASCAKNVEEIYKKHPITRQSIAGVIVLCDLSKGDNKKLFTQQIAYCFYNGARSSVANVLAMSVFIHLAIEERFNVDTLNQMISNIYNNIRGNFLGQNGSTLDCREAIEHYFLMCERGETDIESSLTAIRGQTPSTISQIAYLNFLNTGVSRDMALQYTRKAFMIAMISRHRGTCQHQSGNKMVDALLLRDLFDTSTGVPIYKSSGKVGIYTSQFIKIIFQENYIKYTSKIIKFVFGLNIEEVLDENLITGTLICLLGFGKNFRTQKVEESIRYQLTENPFFLELFTEYTKDTTIIIDGELDEELNKFHEIKKLVEPSSTNPHHNSISRFSIHHPEKLIDGGPVTFCTCCGEKFYTAEQFETKLSDEFLIRQSDAIIEGTIAWNKAQHFRKEYGSSDKTGIPSTSLISTSGKKSYGKTSVHFNLLRETKRYFANFEINKTGKILKYMFLAPNPGPTREMIISIAKNLIKKGTGNIYTADFLKDIAISAFNCICLIRTGFKPSDDSKPINVADKIKHEFEADISDEDMKNFSVNSESIENLEELIAPITDKEFRFIYGIKEDKKLEEIMLPTPSDPPPTYYYTDEDSGSEYEDEGYMDTAY